MDKSLKTHIHTNKTSEIQYSIYVVKLYHVKVYQRTDLTYIKP